MAKLNEMVKEFRLSIGQSVDGLALLMQVTPAEYRLLEVDWIPPDDVLQRMCALFQWNYQDIKRIALQSGGSSVSSAKPLERSTSKTEALGFDETLRNARLAVKQSPEGIATLLNIPVDLYLRIEDGLIPADDLVRRICSLFSWNYLQTKRLLINRSTPRIVSPQPPQSLKELQSRQTKTGQMAPSTTVSHETLGQRLQKGRLGVLQSSEAIAVLLNVPTDYYEELESGAQLPDPDLLKRIAALFHWNFNELHLLVQNANIHQFQPFVTAPSDALASESLIKLQTIQKEIAQDWKLLSKVQQDLLLAQLEIIHKSVKEMKEK